MADAETWLNSTIVESESFILQAKSVVDIQEFGANCENLGRFFFSPVGMTGIFLLALGFGSIPQKIGGILCTDALIGHLTTSFYRKLTQNWHPE